MQDHGEDIPAAADDAAVLEGNAVDAAPGDRTSGEPDVPQHTLRRRSWLTEHVDLRRGRGLEIGPLCSPVVPRGLADVVYLDVQDTDGLRRHYRGDPAVRSEDLVDVDIALYANGRMRSIAEASEDRGPFSWAVASHVVEHVPDLVGWLQDLGETLLDDGNLALVVPDRRYTFDANRPATTTGQLLAAHQRGDQRPSVRAVYDHFSATSSASAHDLWRGADSAAAPRANPPEALSSALSRHATTEEYIDCHAWVVHAQEFIGQLAELFDLGLHSFVVQAVRVTSPGDLEFFVLLRRIPRGTTDDARSALSRSGFGCPPHRLLEPAAPPTGLDARLVTPREWAMVVRKRQLLGPLRSALTALRHRHARPSADYRRY